MDEFFYQVTGSPQGWLHHQSLIEWLEALVVHMKQVLHFC
jgi:hypothetical protein